MRYFNIIDKHITVHYIWFKVMFEINVHVTKDVTCGSLTITMDKLV